MPKISLNLTDEQRTKLDYICTCRQMNMTEVIQKFIETQYDILNKDSQINKTISKIEALSKELEALSKQY